MADVAEHMTAKRDAVYVAERLREMRASVLASLPQDTKLWRTRGKSGKPGLAQLVRWW